MASLTSTKSKLLLSQLQQLSLLSPASSSSDPYPKALSLLFMETYIGRKGKKVVSFKS